jgi:putative phosphoribosyl transferase
MFRLADSTFTDRADAGRRLAERLRDEPLVDPVVIAIPRGGVEVGAEVARALGLPLDVVVTRKLGAEGQPELAIGAIAEEGVERLRPWTPWTGDEGHLGRERERQREELARRVALFRAAVPQVALAGRDAVIVDDGVATGATLHAAIESLRRRGPRSIVAALPVAAPDFIASARDHRGEPGWPDRTVVLSAPDDLVAVGQAYDRFDQVPDERAVSLLVASRSRGPAGVASGRAAGR